MNSVRPCLPSIPAFTLVTLLAFLAGCGSGSSVVSFTPPSNAAEDALTAALEAWKSGEAPGELIETDQMRIQFADAAREAGAKLTDYEIVQALPGDSPRKFSVKLTLEGATAPEEITYVVVGKDPLVVMRDEEYNRTSAM